MTDVVHAAIGPTGQQLSQAFFSQLSGHFSQDRQDGCSPGKNDLPVPAAEDYLLRGDSQIQYPVGFEFGIGGRYQPVGIPGAFERRGDFFQPFPFSLSQKRQAVSDQALTAVIGVEPMLVRQFLENLGQILRWFPVLFDDQIS